MDWRLAMNERKLLVDLAPDCEEGFSGTVFDVPRSVEPAPVPAEADNGAWEEDPTSAQ
jgi:hypothetical protein